MRKVSKVFQGRLKGISKEFSVGFKGRNSKGILGKLQMCFKGASRKIRGCSKKVFGGTSRQFTGGFKKVSWVFQGRLKGISMELKVGFKCI